jgi:hypothetical protein
MTADILNGLNVVIVCAVLAVIAITVGVWLAVQIRRHGLDDEYSRLTAARRRDENRRGEDPSDVYRV